MTLTAETVYWATQHGEIVRLEARTNACTTASVIATYIHRESKKKQDTKLLAITLLTIIRFSKFFH